MARKGGKNGLKKISKCSWEYTVRAGRRSKTGRIPARGMKRIRRLIGQIFDDLLRQQNTQPDLDEAVGAAFFSGLWAA